MDEDNIQILETDDPAIVALVQTANGKLSELRWLNNSLEDCLARVVNVQDNISKATKAYDQIVKTIDMLRVVQRSDDK